jgi:hypothetical protein
MHNHSLTRILETMTSQFMLWDPVQNETTLAAFLSSHAQHAPLLLKSAIIAGSSYKPLIITLCHYLQQNMAHLNEQAHENWDSVSPTLYPETYIELAIQYSNIPAIEYLYNHNPRCLSEISCLVRKSSLSQVIEELAPQTPSQQEEQRKWLHDHDFASGSSECSITARGFWSSSSPEPFPESSPENAAKSSLLKGLSFS